ncbi:unnamed protein product [Pylaiella littoralis]
MADNMNSTAAGRGEKWWSVVKAIAYELKPFSLPTIQGVSNAGRSVRTNAGQIVAEIKRVAPESTTKRTHNIFLTLFSAPTTITPSLPPSLPHSLGAVYFIVSAMVGIFVNLGEREEGEWSAYSVFNAGCRALLGTINAEQFEREIMRQNVAAPDRRDDDDDALLPNNQDDDFVWVEPEPGVRNPAAVAGGDADALEPEADYESEDNDTDDDVDGGGDDGGGGAARGAAGARGRKVSGKRARRGFEERKERQEERRLALQALGQEGWE